MLDINGAWEAKFSKMRFKKIVIFKKNRTAGSCIEYYKCVKGLIIAFCRC